MRFFGDLHQAPRIRSNILWCVVRSLVLWPFRGAHVAHPYKRASTTSDHTIRALRGSRLAFGRSYSSRV